MTTFNAFEVICNNDNFIMINKAANISFHNEENGQLGLFTQVKQSLNLTTLYPVHRLDKMTSGLVIFAKNLITAQQFQQLFSQHKIEKYYLAISDQKPKKKQGLIKGDMAKSRRGSYKLLRSQENPAITQFFSYGLGHKKLRLFVIKPHSGKTHQIRVALNSISAPILGDNRYAGNAADRGYLHAFAVKFILNTQCFSYVCLPKSGDSFLLPSTLSQLETITPPWLLPWPTIK
jgi:tRNA pseudouridine32 synthase/23S rRNA pseudouridine746 synthase